MEATYLAPSGCNLQTSRIIGILDQEKIQSLGEIYGREWAKTAKAVVIIATKEGFLKGKGPSRHKEDFGAAAQNLLLAVKDLGLGTTWIQGQIEDGKNIKMGKLLKAPEEYTVMGYFQYENRQKK